MDYLESATEISKLSNNVKFLLVGPIEIGPDGIKKTDIDKYKEKNFIVLGIPSNQFGGQEPGSNNEIKNFCTTNFNITFPMTDKVNVKGADAHTIYRWAKENHGNSTIPKWNFHKILISKEGKIHDTFNSFVTPLSDKITKQIELIL